MSVPGQSHSDPVNSESHFMCNSLSVIEKNGKKYVGGPRKIKKKYVGGGGEKIKICEGVSAKFSIPPPQDLKWNNPKTLSLYWGNLLKVQCRKYPHGILPGPSQVEIKSSLYYLLLCKRNTRSIKCNHKRRLPFPDASHA